MRNTLRRLVAPLALCLAAAAPVQAQNQAAPYPSKMVKLIVGFPAGQATDLIARMLAEKMSAAFGQPVIVENRPGQGGSMALGAVARSAPDGYTMILAASGGLVTNPHLYAGKVSFNPNEDFEPITLVADLPLLLVTSPSKPYNSVKDVIEQARKNPGKLNYASTGNGTSSHLSSEALKRGAQLDMVHVPYPGSVKAITDLMTNNVDFLFDTVAATRPFITSGKLKLLAVGSSKRMEFFPDTPTLVESGLSNVPASVWIGMLFPKGTPEDIVNKVNAQLVKDINEPAMQRKLLEMGVLSHTTSPKEFGRFIKDESARMGKLVHDTGVRAD